MLRTSFICTFLGQLLVASVSLLSRSICFVVHVTLSCFWANKLMIKCQSNPSTFTSLLQFIFYTQNNIIRRLLHFLTSGGTEEWYRRLFVKQYRWWKIVCTPAERTGHCVSGRWKAWNRLRHNNQRITRLLLQRMLLGNATPLSSRRQQTNTVR